VQDKQLTTDQVNTFKEKMHDLFTKSDKGFDRRYMNPDSYFHERVFWRLAKTAVALYEH
jgi:hypothetical protein